MKVKNFLPGVKDKASPVEPRSSRNFSDVEGNVEHSLSLFQFN